MSETAASEESVRCFVIAPIGAKGTEIRRRSDQILEYIIRPVVSDYGYQALRADEIAATGLITSQVIQEVIDAPLVIADLTDHNPNVFYELALRHAFRKPVIQLIQADQQLPFDVGGLRTIFVDHQDLESVEACKQELRKHIEGIQAGQDDGESPISVAVDLEQLRRSEDPVEKSTGEILESLAELHRMVRGLVHQQRSPYRDPMTEEARQVIMRQFVKDAKLRQEASAPPSVPSVSTPPAPWVPSYDDEDRSGSA